MKSIGQITMVPRAAAIPKGNVFAGTWTANLAKSELHPANPFQRATLVFTIVGDTVTIAQVFVDPSGHEVGGRMTIQADGREHPSEYGNGHALIARWIGPHILEAVDMKDGQIFGRGTYEVSGDGKTLTVSTNEQRIVLDLRSSVVPLPIPAEPQAAKPPGRTLPPGPGDTAKVLSFAGRGSGPRRNAS